MSTRAGRFTNVWMNFSLLFISRFKVNLKQSKKVFVKTLRLTRFFRFFKVYFLFVFIFVKKKVVYTRLEIDFANLWKLITIQKWYSVSNITLQKQMNNLTANNWWLLDGNRFVSNLNKQKNSPVYNSAPDGIWQLAYMWEKKTLFEANKVIFFLFK